MRSIVCCICCDDLTLATAWDCRRPDHRSAFRQRPQNVQRCTGAATDVGAMNAGVRSIFSSWPGRCSFGQVLTVVGGKTRELDGAAGATARAGFPFPEPPGPTGCRARNGALPH